VTRRWWRSVLFGVVCLIGGGQASEATALDDKAEGTAAPERNWQASLAPSYSSGNFGTGSTTNFLYVPLTIRRYFADGDVSFVAPTACITGNGTVTLLSGQPNRVDNRGSNSGPGGGGTSGSSGRLHAASGPGSGGSGSNSGPKNSSGDDISPLTGQTLNTRTTTCGVGDLLLKGRYYLVEEREWVPLIAVTGRIKMPTADPDRGLGTGKWDEGVGLELTKRVGDNWITYVDGGFTIIGRLEGANFRNQWWYDVGVGYYFTRFLTGSLYYEEYRSIVSGLQNIRDVLVTLDYRASDEWRFNSSLQLGLSNGAPDYGITFGVSRRF
jgi:hypothetical protein